MKQLRYMFILLFFVFSCDEFLVKDISDKKVKLQTPENGYATTETQLRFWWNAMEEADQYRLMIASPDFDNPQTLVLDSLTSNKGILISLSPGKYEWCVQGVNAAFTSESSCRTLEILASPDEE